MPGTLYVVATPLGNLEDLSPRALRVLREVTLIACEDTRQTAKILLRHRVETRTLSCHKFNERERLEPVLSELESGQDVALVSDGGTPGVSDPGALLVRAAHERHIAVSPVPGPSAVCAILAASGLDAGSFVFDGFLPHRAGERRKRLRELRHESRTIVVFETPHRIRASLRDIRDVLGDDRAMTLGRELTKMHETVIRASASELDAALGDDPVRGEITLAIQGAGTTVHETADDRKNARLLAVWRNALEEAGGDRREALRRAARALGVKRAELNRDLAELGE